MPIYMRESIAKTVFLVQHFARTRTLARDQTWRRTSNSPSSKTYLRQDFVVLLDRRDVLAFASPRRHSRVISTALVWITSGSRGLSATMRNGRPACSWHRTTAAALVPRAPVRDPHGGRVIRADPRGDTLDPGAHRSCCLATCQPREGVLLSRLRQPRAGPGSCHKCCEQGGWKSAGIPHATWLQRACRTHECTRHRKAVYVVATGSHEGLPWILADPRRRLREEVPEEPERGQWRFLIAYRRRINKTTCKAKLKYPVFDLARTEPAKWHSIREFQ